MNPEAVSAGGVSGSAPAMPEAGQSTGIEPARARLLLAAIVCLGIALRSDEMATRSLWFDEAFSYWITRLPWADLLEHVGWDNHPPLHFVLLKAWTMVFGASLLALRSLGVLLGSLAIVGAYLFTVEAQRGPARADGAAAEPPSQARGTALWVAALVSLSIFQIRASWDVRMYSLGAALAAFSSWALFRALHAPRRRVGFWLLYALFALLFLYTHYFALFTIAAQSLFLASFLLTKARGNILLIWRQPAFPGAVLAAVLICLGWFPWMAHFLDRRSQVGASFWVPEVSWISFRANGYHMMIEPECYVRACATWPALFCALLCLALPLALLWKPRAVDWFVAGAALLPIGLAVLASTAFRTQIFYSRYFLFAHVFIMASLGLLLGRIRPRWARWTAGGLILLAMLVVDLRLILKLAPQNNPSARGVAAYIEEHRRPGEPVIVCSQLYYLPLRYHAASPTGWYQYGTSSEPGSLDAWTAMGAENVMDPDRMRALPAGRAWAVDMQSEFGSPSEVPVPNRWIARSRRAFRDTYGLERELVVIEYEVVPK
jgi:hypothetical protein